MDVLARCFSQKLPGNTEHVDVSRTFRVTCQHYRLYKQNAETLKINPCNIFLHYWYRWYVVRSIPSICVPKCIYLSNSTFNLITIYTNTVRMYYYGYLYGYGTYRGVLYLQDFTIACLRIISAAGDRLKCHAHAHKP